LARAKARRRGYKHHHEGTTASNEDLGRGANPLPHLETIGQISDDPLISLPAVAR
jgi:hypothetical protein